MNLERSGERSMKSKKKIYSVYVIKLSNDIAKTKKFLIENPNYDSSKPCVYVGRTSKTPEKRCEEHLTGARNKRGPLYSRKVKRYGIKLMPKLYEHLNPLTEDESIKLEKELSEQLREKGYGVWYR